jgi:Transmembrane domain of unknown function (DUF3566)
MEKRRVRRIGVLSAAKIQGLIGFVVGLIIGIFYALFALIGGAVITSIARSAGSESPLGGLGMGIIGAVAAIIILPIFYGIVSFIVGAISALIYNAAARLTGGIEVEFEAMGPAYAPPPPPQQWAPNPYPSS